MSRARGMDDKPNSRAAHDQAKRHDDHLQQRLVTVDRTAVGGEGLLEESEQRPLNLGAPGHLTHHHVGYAEEHDGVEGTDRHHEKRVGANPKGHPED